MMVVVQRDELAEFDVTGDEFDAMLADSEPAEVTGPLEAAHKIHFELVRGRLRTYGWRVVAANGEILATSATTYSSRSAARRAVSAIAVALRDAPIIEPTDPDSASG